MSVTFGLWANFQARGWSLAPPPTTRMFRVYRSLCVLKRGGSRYAYSIPSLISPQRGQDILKDTLLPFSPGRGSSPRRRLTLPHWRRGAPGPSQISAARRVFAFDRYPEYCPEPRQKTLSSGLSGDNPERSGVPRLSGAGAFAGRESR